MDNNNSCSGPSAFKSLSNHLERDNSLHQERLRDGSGAGQANGFRTQGQNAQQAQNNFAAFMDEGPQLPVEHAATRLDGLGSTLQQPPAPQGFHQSYQIPQGFHYSQAPSHASTATTAPPAANNWVAEFQAQNARQAMPTPQGGQPAVMQQPMAQMPFQPRPFAGMADPFVSAPTPQLPMIHRAPPSQHAQSNMPYAPLYDPANRTLNQDSRSTIRTDADEDFNQEMDAWMRSNGSDLTAEQMARVDNELAAVADEFDQEAAARREATIVHIEEQLDLQSPLEQMSLTDLAQQELTSLSAADQATDAAAQDAAGPSTAAATDNDLAQAAGRLLDSVEHETGEKWTNSSFLQLMRDFRDGKKTVVDNILQDEEEPDFHDVKGKGPARGPEDDDGAPPGGNAGMV